ncbi:MAG TPA: hypothetical protein VGI27_07465, partial [Solirubrobacteraceae bacterium]
MANSSDGTLTRIDAVTGDVVKTIALGAGATDVAVGTGASEREVGDRVHRVDPPTDQIAAMLNVGTGPSALAVGFWSLWVANSLDETVSRIDPQTNTVTGNGRGGRRRGRGRRCRRVGLEPERRY